MTSSTHKSSSSRSHKHNSHHHSHQRPTPELTRRMGTILRALPGNEVCADCPAKSKPQWVSFLSTNRKEGGSKHLGVLVCTDCAQNHYFTLGDKRCHIQYLQNAHEFSDLDVAVLEDSGGNHAVNAILEAKLTSKDFDKDHVDPDPEIEDKRRAKFIKYKYKKHKFVDETAFQKLIIFLLKQERKRMEQRDQQEEEEERSHREEDERRRRRLEQEDDDEEEEDYRERRKHHRDHRDHRSKRDDNRRSSSDRRLYEERRESTSRRGGLERADSYHSRSRKSSRKSGRDRNLRQGDDDNERRSRRSRSKRGLNDSISTEDLMAEAEDRRRRDSTSPNGRSSIHRRSRRNLQASTSSNDLMADASSSHHNNDALNSSRKSASGRSRSRRNLQASFSREDLGRDSRDMLKQTRARGSNKNLRPEEEEQEEGQNRRRSSPRTLGREQLKRSGSYRKKKRGNGSCPNLHELTNGNSNSNGKKPILRTRSGNSPKPLMVVDMPPPSSDMPKRISNRDKDTLIVVDKPPAEMPKRISNRDRDLHASSPNLRLEGNEDDDSGQSSQQQQRNRKQPISRTRSGGKTWQGAPAPLHQQPPPQPKNVRSIANDDEEEEQSQPQRNNRQPVARTRSGKGAALQNKPGALSNSDTPRASSNPNVLAHIRQNKAAALQGKEGALSNSGETGKASSNPNVLSSIRQSNTVSLAASLTVGASSHPPQQGTTAATTSTPALQIKAVNPSAMVASSAAAMRLTSNTASTPAVAPDMVLPAAAYSSSNNKKSHNNNPSESSLDQEEDETAAMNGSINFDAADTKRNFDWGTKKQPPQNKLQSLANDFVRSTIVSAMHQEPPATAAGRPMGGVTNLPPAAASLAIGGFSSGASPAASSLAIGGISGVAPPAARPVGIGGGAPMMMAPIPPAAASLAIGGISGAAPSAIGAGTATRSIGMSQVPSAPRLGGGNMMLNRGHASAARMGGMNRVASARLVGGAGGMRRVPSMGGNNNNQSMQRIPSLAGPGPGGMMMNRESSFRRVTVRDISGAGGPGVPQRQQQQQPAPRLTSDAIRAKLMASSKEAAAAKAKPGDGPDTTESTVDLETDEMATNNGMRKIQSVGGMGPPGGTADNKKNKVAMTQSRMSASGLARLRANMR